MISFDTMKQISLRMPEELLELVDGARGQVPRQRWLRSVIAAEVAMAPREVTEPARRVIDTTLEPGQVSLAPCNHSWLRVDGKSVCKHCGQTYTRPTKEKI